MGWAPTSVKEGCRPVLRSGETLEIRDLLDEGLSVSEIARRVGRDRKTVRAAIQRECTALPRRRRGGVKRDVKLEPFKDYLQSRMAKGVFHCGVLMDELRARGYTGRMTVLRRYVHSRRPSRVTARPVVRFETPPGRQGQADFVDIPALLPDGSRQLLRLFNYTLGFSRYAAMQFMPNEGRTSWLRALDHAFRATGGVPHEVLTDRASALVIGSDDNGRPLFAPEYQAFADHYGFVPKVAREAQTKGKVERQGGYVQDNLLPRLDGVITAPIDLNQLNSRVDHWLSTIANVRVHGTTHRRPIDLVRDEQAALGALPSVAFGLDQIASRHVSMDGYVRWKTCRYQVPWMLFDRDVYVHETPERRLVVEFDGRYVVNYPLSIERHALVDHPGFKADPIQAAARSSRVLAIAAAPEVEAWSPAMYERFAQGAGR